MKLPFVGCASHRLNLAEYMESYDAPTLLGKLLEELKAFESFSKKLQNTDGLSLLDVRDIFDALIAEHPGVEDYLGTEAGIVQQPEFENACVTVLVGTADSLTECQRSLLLPFAAPATTPPLVEDKTLGFADRALEKRKLQCEMPCEYPEIAVIPPTTNICERFFSQSKYVLGNDHQGLLPINLEIILFLKVNLHLWNVKTEADVVNASKWDVCKR
ncbi:hypothetical protein JG687_00009145 [Phytophthora cactorum]|uniref:HAT C-terminal dimerisation domain-containing protein n=1 Tax=Phytophthora cactorum TaxID=29920 RepID=A0A8T1UAH1_9STRA|nr:hypothetical protein JG687_00009145 [Phytophthora cactorum]